MAGDSCHRCGRTGHVARECAVRTCFRCNGRGHMAWECTVGVLCSGCGEQGHLQRTCPHVACHKCGRRGHIAKFCSDPFAKALAVEHMERHEALQDAHAARAGTGSARGAASSGAMPSLGAAGRGPRGLPGARVPAPGPAAAAAAVAPSPWDGLGRATVRCPPVLTLKVAPRPASHEARAGIEPGASKQSRQGTDPGASKRSKQCSGAPSGDGPYISAPKRVKSGAVSPASLSASAAHASVGLGHAGPSGSGMQHGPASNGPVSTAIAVGPDPSSFAAQRDRGGGEGTPGLRVLPGLAAYGSDEEDQSEGDTEGHLPSTAKERTSEG